MGNDDNESILSDQGDVRFFNSRSQSIKLARKDKANKKSFALIQTWRKQASEAEKKSKTLRVKTGEAEKIMFSQVRLYEAKLDAAYTKKYKF
eukprot:4619858-Prymnesium_polylepis.1